MSPASSLDFATSSCSSTADGHLGPVHLSPDVPACDAVHFLAASTTDACFDSSLNLTAPAFWARVEELLAKRMTSFGSEWFLVSVAAVTPSSRLAQLAFDLGASKLAPPGYWTTPAALDDSMMNSSTGGTSSSPKLLARRTLLDQATVWSAALLSIRRVLQQQSASAASAASAASRRQDAQARQNAKSVLLSQCVPFARNALLSDAQLQTITLACSPQGQQSTSREEREENQMIAMRLTVGVCTLLQLLVEHLHSDFSQPQSDMLQLHRTAVSLAFDLCHALDPPPQQQQQEATPCACYRELAQPTNWPVCLITSQLITYLFAIDGSGNNNSLSSGGGEGAGGPSFGGAEEILRSVAESNNSRGGGAGEDDSLLPSCVAQIYVAAEFVQKHGQLHLAASGERCCSTTTRAHTTATLAAAAPKRKALAAFVENRVLRQAQKSAAAAAAAHVPAEARVRVEIDQFVAAADRMISLMQTAGAMTAEQKVRIQQLSSKLLGT
jgi:hypothetical protein